MQPTIIIAPDEAAFHSSLYLQISPSFYTAPDAYIIRAPEGRILIEQIREAQSSLKLAGAVSTFIIYRLDTAQDIAQHALLKTIEQRHEHINMFFWVISIDLLLPTIISRCVVRRSAVSDITQSDHAMSAFISTLFASSTPALFHTNV